MGESPREFSRSEYRRQSAWPERIRRESSFLLDVLDRAPRGGRVLDLGCGTGEHARFLAERWGSVVGVDTSRAAVEEAHRCSPPSRARWIRGDLRFLPLASDIASVAMCLGNTLAILGDDAPILDALRRMYETLRSGGFLLIQILNYYKLRAQGSRYLPLNFRDDSRSDLEGTRRELVYLRLMDFDSEGHVDFHVVTMARSLDGDDVHVVDSVRRRLRSLEYRELESLLREAGFADIELYGSYAPIPLDPEDSSDVIALARRR